MRLHHRWLALAVALWAAAAAAEPVIVDPDPADPDVDWGLAIAPVPLNAPLAAPQGLVLVGTQLDQAMFVIEKNTGRVRHFVSGADQGDVLDLAVDNCGERGLIGIALDPRFDRSTPDTSDPDAPWADWVYLSYHTDEGRGADGCDGGAELRVERYTWNGAALINPLRLYTGSLAAGETQQVGGVIATNLEVSFAPMLGLFTAVYVAIGAQGRDGSLQNNSAVPRVLDDTSVLLRLREDGTTPTDNPFDIDPDVEEPQDRYFAYGIGDPRGLTVDPFSSLVWSSERSDAGLDEIDVLLPTSNGGYRPYQGYITTLPSNLLGDGSPNPAYPLVDLVETSEPDPADRKPASTYLNPPFTFEAADVGPTGVAFGGVEVGPQHEGSLFVGTADGRVLRFRMDPSTRQVFSLPGTLADREANLPVPDDPDTELDESQPADDLSQVLIATGFGAISDLERGVDGSMYVLDRDNGTVHHIFWDAVRDLGILKAKVPTKIKLSDKKPVVTKSARVTLVNRGEAAVRITSPAALDGLIGVQPIALGGCAAPTVDVVDPKYALPPYNFAIGIAPGGRLDLEVDIAWTCDSPNPKGEPDFETRFLLNGAAIGIIDENPDNDACPRAPMGDDPGCGPKKGPGFFTDLIRK
jgi:Glucose / Sorbosone dehydrogenase